MSSSERTSRQSTDRNIESLLSPARSLSQGGDGVWQGHHFVWKQPTSWTPQLTAWLAPHFRADAMRRLKPGRFRNLCWDDNDRRISKLTRRRWMPMLDDPEKTPRLLAALKAAVPFQVELAPFVVKQLQADKVATASHQIVSDLSYAGDEGGIMCHLNRSEETGRALVVSLTYVRVPRSMPLAAGVLDYQKHRVKKLKKQGRT